MPEDTVAGYNPATVANGEIGLVVGSKPMSIDRVICSGAYHDGSENGVSCIVEGINPVNLLMSVDGIQVSDFDGWVQELDMYGAVHKTCFNARGLSVTSSMRALRHMPYAAMADIKIKAERDISAMFVNIHKIPESLDAGRTEHRRVWCEDGGRKLLRSQASYNRGKDIIVATSVMIPDENCIQMSADTVIMELKKGQHASFSLISSICTTQSFSDPWNESERQVIYAIRQGREALQRQHGLRWADLWKGDITVEGNQDLTRIARFALFNLYGSIREGSRRSIPPMGLTSRGYNGHIFWDAETWIFPVLLKLHPHLAKEMISYRIDRLENARRRAYVYGYGGAMFPWESDHQGEESTPTFALTGPLEHHITADVAIAAWQYFEEMTDTVWLREEGFPLMRECAEFWLSRADINDDGSFSIRNVVGADEYAIGVDDNAYTNGAVIRALELTSKAAEACGVVQDYRWKDMASRLRIHRSSSGV